MDGKLGIFTDNNYQRANIQVINTERINQELEKGKIVIIARVSRNK